MRRVQDLFTWSRSNSVTAASEQSGSYRRATPCQIAAMLILMVAALTFSCQPQDTVSQKLTMQIGVHTIHIEIAADPAKRARGLMGRDYLADDEGMLFVFKQKKIRSFWMKNTYIPLALAYIDNARIVQIVEMEPYDGRPEDELPCYKSKCKVKYALEMAGGWFKRHGIKVGERVVLPYWP